MKEKNALRQLKKEIDSFRAVDKAWFLSLLDDGAQKAYEDNHLHVLLIMLRYYYLSKERETVRRAQEELAAIRNGEDHSANAYARTLKLNGVISAAYATMEGYKHFFDEPYFARMDVRDDKEGYHAYYIGKKGDLNLGVVDWRAPLARRYYQKSQRYFSINEYDYTVILRRAIRTHAGKVLEFKNEHLSVREYLSKEEIDGRDEEIVLDPYLREIIRARKDEESVRDIIETIQEKQFDLITRPECESFILQGCAGSGKTMVLLHRLSYLMYNNEQLSPRDVLVITPSQSFNSFIDELSQVLELEKVRTITLQDYFLQVLLKAGVDIADRMNGAKESEEYLTYLYSPAFSSDVEALLAKVFDEVYGLFASEECRDFTSQILADCRAQKQAYVHIKNASVRLRRTVLGEIKEDAEGNPRYTKPFRDFMNDVSEIEDFLSLGVEEGVTKPQAYFYRQLARFYRSAAQVTRVSEAVVADALQSLESFKETLKKEIKDLRRYRIRVGDREEFTYAERIQAREALLKETDGVIEDVNDIGEHCSTFTEFFRVLQGQKNLTELGKCRSTLDLARYFYNLTVKKKKNEFGMTEKGLYKSDAFSILCLLSALGQELYPHYSLVFVDEGQDISAQEYELLRKINQSAAFNIYGDLQQNVTPWRSVSAWEQAFEDIPVYSLNQNYRNTNQIVEFVHSFIDADMYSFGFDGAPVVSISLREAGTFLKEKKGIKAIIAAEKELP
ncbi:MAG: hypothetical protein IJY26_03690, partial [Clostridia bacterium]|nr:hypothetical protein [Clostridia bacterium]